jgi:hypothetical protein
LKSPLCRQFLITEPFGVTGTLQRNFLLHKKALK